MQSLPLYYDDAGSGERPFLPFIVAPLRASQDTVILGPASISEFHDDFINHLYRGITTNNIRGMALRVFMYRGMTCVAIILPTDQRDEAGRPGLAVSLGFCISKNSFALKSKILSEYLRAFLNAMNRVFFLSLPKPSSANRLLELITVAYGYSDKQHEMKLQFELIIDTLFVLGAAAADFAKVTRKRRFDLGRLRIPRRMKLPRVILYAAGTSSDVIFQIFFREWSLGLRRLDATAVEGLLGPDEAMDAVALIPVSDYLDTVRKVKFRKDKTQSYLTIY